MIDTLHRISAADLEGASRALIRAHETPSGLEIEMPVVYPNGECVSVVVTTVPGSSYIVHDAGLGAMYLTSAGLSLTQKLTDKLMRLAQTYGCEFISGRMSRSCDENQLAIAIALVANASRAVGDQALEHREKKIRDFRKEVSLVLRDVLPQQRLRSERVIGTSGTEYQVSNVVLTPDGQHTLAFIEPVADQKAVDKRFREFFDIASNENYSGVQRISVFDDRSAWRDGDIAVLNRVSNTVPFSSLPKRARGLAA